MTCSKVRIINPNQLLTTIEAQNTKINELEKELAQVKAERDKYWDALAGKVGR
jgi:hypothetical protein